jgi:hypothetical protein
MDEPELEGYELGKIYCECGIQIIGDYEYILKKWNTRPNASEGVDVEYRLTWCDECEKALVTNSTRCGCKNLLKEFPIHLVRNPDSRIKEAIEEVDNSIKAIHEEYGCEVPSDSIILTLTKIKTTLEK